MTTCERQSKNSELSTRDLYPTAHDPRFSGGRWRTVFVSSEYGRDPRHTGYGNEEIAGASYIDDDRIPSEAFDRTRAEAENDHTAEFFERLVRNALDRSDVELVHISSRVSPMTGGPQHAYGFVTPIKHR